MQPSFIENKGQVTDQYAHSRSDIDYKLVAGNGLNIFIGNGHIHYQWAKAAGSIHTAAGGGDRSPSTAPIDDVTPPVDMYRMDVSLVGANPQARISAENKLLSQERYYLPATGGTGVVAYSYARIIYHDVYPNIDWMFYINESGKLEHDFIIREGGKVSDIILKYEGSTELQLADKGSLQAVTPMGSISEAAPISYEKDSRKQVASSFVLKDGFLSFSTAGYKGTLVIDPTIEWATYYGGILYDEVRSLVYGKDGNLYATGATSSTDNIATVGSYQSSYGGGVGAFGGDAFVAKFQPDGTLLWSTYYGGSGDDPSSGIAVDTAGDIYIAGRTTSPTGLGTTGAYQEAKAGTPSGNDAYLVKFDTSGARTWGTYFGGTGQDANISVNVTTDRFGSIILTGNTSSTNGIATTGAYQPDRAGGNDAFLAKFTASGSLIWATYYGGTDPDNALAVVTDTLGNIFMAGNTFSSTGLSSIDAYQTIAAGDNEGFLAKFDSAGQRVWGTYFGGSGAESITAITIDLGQHIYIGGYTLSDEGIATNNAHQTVFAGPDNSGDGFIARFSNEGQLDWASYYGGDQYDAVNAIYYSGDGKVYIGGSTLSTTGIASTNGINTELNGGGDGFLAAFDSTGTRLWATYLGGNSADVVLTLTGNTTGYICAGGNTSSTLQLATPNAYQTSFGGDQDGMIISINTCELPQSPDNIAGPATACAGSNQIYRITSPVPGTSYTWIVPQGWTGSSVLDSITVGVGAQSGDLRVAATNECGSSDTISITVSVNPAPVPLIQRNGNVLNTTQAFDAYQWNKDGMAMADATGATYLVTEDGDYTVTVTNSNGCSGTSEVTAVSGMTGIEDLLSASGISIYPNPAERSLFIKSPIAARISIASMTGQSVYQGKLHTGTNQIDLSTWASGVYMVLLRDADGNMLGGAKLMKQ